jgi:hypothetical protein
MSEKLDRARNEVAHHLDAIKRLFVNGAKLTILARPPGGDVEKEFLLTDDDLDEVAHAIERAKKREAA